MEDYGYYNRKLRRSRSEQPTAGSRLLRIADAVALVLTVLCSVLLVCALLARFADPRKAYFFAFAGLIFPMLYVAEIALCLWWVVRWRVYAVVAALVLLFGLRTAGSYYRPDFRRHYDTVEPAKSQFTVMSYNVQGFNPKYRTDEAGTRELIAGLINENNIDIVCFQEFATARSNPPLNELLSDYRYYKTFPYAPEDEGKGSYAGLAIYSRYPILNSSLLPSDGCERSFAAWADVKIKLDTVRIFAVHLNSTHIDSEDISYLVGLRHGDVDTGNRSHIFSMTGKLRNTYKKRAPQALAVAESIAQSPYPVVVCGDFNDTPASFAYHNVRKGLSDAFVKRGSGIDATYSGFLNMFRIDYIMCSRSLTVTRFMSFDEHFSDHTPIAAGFDFAAR